VLCLIVGAVRLPPDRKSFAVKINNNNNNKKYSIAGSIFFEGAITSSGYFEQTPRIFQVTSRKRSGVHMFPLSAHVHMFLPNSIKWLLQTRPSQLKLSIVTSE
jgi:hypothetical protein